MDWSNDHAARKLRNKIFLDLPTFPLDCFPAHIRDFVRAVAANVQVSPDMVALPLLAIVAGTVQKRFQVRIDNAYVEPLCLYTVTVARPSERKSAVLSILRAPLWDYRKAYCEKHYISKFTPYVDDVTPEKMAKLMDENEGWINIISDEPDALEVAAGLRYGRNNGNLGLLLQAWSAGPVQIQRMSDDRRISIDRATICIAIMSQPRFLQNVMANPDLTERGFVQRLLFVQPKSMIGERSFMKPDIPPSLMKEYHDLIFALMDASIEGGEGVQDIRLSDSARFEAEAAFQELERRLVEELAPMEGWAGKLFGQILRIAGILHCMNCAEFAAESEITMDEMISARCIGDYLLEHAKSIYLGIDADPEYQNLKYFWERLRDSGKDELSAEEIQRLSKFKAETNRKYLDYLVMCKFLVKKTLDSGGRPKTIYMIVED